LYYRLYTATGWLLVIVALPFFALFCLVTGRNPASLRQRLGFFNPSHAFKHHNRLWFHAASVGEVQAAKALISALQQIEVQADIIVTTVTEQGLSAAKRQLIHTSYCLYAPIDLPWVIERFVEKLRPSIYICLETELWPNMLRVARARGVKTLLLNGRLSERAFRRYQYFTGFMGQVVRCFNSASVIQDIDRERYLALGFDPKNIEVHGNAKYDLHLESLFERQNYPPRLTGFTLKESAARHYQELLGLDRDQQVLLAGSTHTGEEAIILDAYESLVFTIPDLVLLIAPRHLDRLDQIKTDLLRKGIPVQTFSQVLAGQPTARIIVVDRMGELAKLYAVATYVFCGGSLVPRGGHNIMEPAIWGIPPLYGPHMNDFSDACTLLESAQAGYPVQNKQELVDKIIFFHHHQNEYQQASQRALTILSAQQGAAVKQAEIIRRALC
jgi:3-deoxy-D-manno-octulosonic-acid transferase